MLNDYTFFWMILGFLLIVADLTFLPGIGAFFVGLGAITTYILLKLEFVGTNDLVQVLCFLTTTLAWTCILWIPLKKFASSKHSNTYNNMVGEDAIVFEEELLVGKSGNIKWSGVVLKAELIGKPDEKAMIGETVVINSVKGNVVYVRRKE